MNPQNEFFFMNEEENFNFGFEDIDFFKNKEIISDLTETNKDIFEDNIFSHKNNENLFNINNILTADITNKEQNIENSNDLNNNNQFNNQVNLVDKDNNLIIYEKRGRKKKSKNESKNSKIILKEHKINNLHSKENDDNIRRKIKCHFHNFIISYFNNLIKEKKKGNLKFKKIKYSYALNDTMKFNKTLLFSKISDFFKLEISSKYKNYQKNENELVYEKLIKRFDNEVRQLFDLTYMEFYEKYYLNEAFNNSKLKNFYSLFKNERNKESDENKIRYSNLLKLIAEQRFINYYLPNRLFMTQKFFSNI
jgi:hypothetical protein